MSLFQSSNSELSLDFYQEPVDLHRACRIGELTTIKQAFEAQPQKLNEKEVGLGWSPLYRTVICGHFEAAHFLLERGADADNPNNLGETPLHQAADNSQFEMAELLLNFKANPNQVQNDGESPLHHAAFKGDAHMVKLLLQHGADPNLPNYVYRRTPLHYAVDCEHTECVYLMMKTGADATLKDNKGLSPVDLVKDPKVLQVLLAKEECGEDPTDLLTSGFLTPNSEENLSSITDMVSYDNSEANGPGFLSTFGLGHNTVESIVQKDFQMKPLYDWLWKINLPQVYDLLVEAGYDDINSMIRQMLSPLPITEEKLLKIGVRKPGHRKKLVLRLQEEAGIIPRRGIRRLGQNRGMLKCCIAPSNATAAFNLTLLEWLESLNLGFLLGKFEDAGYDDYEAIVCTMLTPLKITDQNLREDVGIQDRKQREVVLKKLQSDCSLIVAENSGPMFDEPKNTACDLCIIM